MDLDLSCFRDLSPFGIPCFCEGIGLMPPFWRLFCQLARELPCSFELRDVGIKNLSLSLSDFLVSFRCVGPHSSVYH